MSPYWDKEFEDAVSDGAIEKPPEHVSLGGSWSSITDTGEATNLNLVCSQTFTYFVLIVIIWSNRIINCIFLVVFCCVDICI